MNYSIRPGVSSTRACFAASAWMACALAVPAAADADTCIPAWQARFGSSADDAILAMARDDDGHVYLAGYEGAAGSNAGHMPAGSLGFVEKRSPLGEPLWRTEFDTAGADSVDAIALHEQGLVLAGTTTGAFPGQAHRGKRDVFVATLDPAGNTLALVQAGDERPQQVGAIARLPDGSVIVAGYDDIHIVGNAVIDWENGFVARFVDAGDDLRVDWWQRSSSRASDIHAGAAAAPDGSGDFFVTTSSARSPGSIAGTSVKRMRADGDEVWMRQVSPITLDVMQKVVVDSERLYVGGMTLGSIAGPSLGGSDALVLALDPASGDAHWSRQLGSTHGDWLADMAAGTAGELHVAGTSWVRDELDPANDREDVFGILLESATGRTIAAARFEAPSLAANPRLIVPAGCDDRMFVSGPASLDPPGLGGTDAIVRPLALEPVDLVFEDGFGVLVGSVPADRAWRSGNPPGEKRIRAHQPGQAR